MTLPYERTRSLVQTADFLRQLSRNQEIPDSLRNEAKRPLRHYPDADLVLGLGKFEEILAATAPEDPKREIVIQLHSVILSSSTKG